MELDPTILLLVFIMFYGCCKFYAFLDSDNAKDIKHSLNHPYFREYSCDNE